MKTSSITQVVKFRRTTLEVTFEQRNKPFGKAHFIGVAKVPGFDTVEVFSTPKAAQPFCARIKVKPGLYAHYFAPTPGKAFANATHSL